MTCARLVALVSAILLSASIPASAEQAGIILAPVNSLGGKVSRDARAVEALLARALPRVTKLRVISDTKRIRKAIRRSQKRELVTCAGETKCLVGIAKLMKADFIVHGEVGGLGSARVVYVKVVDVGKQRELRSTTFALESKGSDVAAHAALVRLLEPSKYVGRLVLKWVVVDADIYVDGRLLGKATTQPLRLAVGTHALRLTHPERRDFVRFVDIAFDSDTMVNVRMPEIGTLRSTLQGSKRSGAVVYKGTAATPWYRKWYTIAGAGAVIVGAATVTAILLTDGVDADARRPIGN